VYITHKLKLTFFQNFSKFENTVQNIKNYDTYKMKLTKRKTGAAVNKSQNFFPDFPTWSRIWIRIGIKMVSWIRFRIGIKMVSWIRIRIGIKMVSWIRIRIGIKTMPIPNTAKYDIKLADTGTAITCLMASIRPSIMSEGATMSAPARAKASACSAILGRLAALSMDPSQKEKEKILMYTVLKKQ
jgi:hypothetical protein